MVLVQDKISQDYIAKLVLNDFNSINFICAFAIITHSHLWSAVFIRYFSPISFKTILFEESLSHLYTILNYYVMGICLKIVCVTLKQMNISSRLCCCVVYCSVIVCYSTCRLNGANVAFGVVLEGMDVVQKMESQGTQSGEVKSKVVIDDCGQINNH